MGKEITIFYSWQSDTDGKINRGFIRNALKEAIKKVNKAFEVEDALRDETLKLDQDTSEVPGTPDIANTIFNKIDLCSVFVPDLTYVAEDSKREKVPNANVLIELGYALKAKGDSRLILVMNEAFGSPEDYELPFDLKHKRWPIRYNLPEDADLEVRQQQKQRLVAELVDAIGLILKSGVLAESELETQKVKPAFPEIEPYGISHFVSESEKIVTLVNDDGTHTNVFYASGPNAFLRFIPTKPVGEKLQSELYDLSWNLRPMTYLIPPIFSRAMNKHGVVLYATEEMDNRPLIYCLTQVFTNGEIWGIDGTILRGGQLFDKTPIIPYGAIENLFYATFLEYRAFYQSVLEIEPPIKYVAGLDRVQDFTLSPTKSICFQYDVVYKGMMDSYETSPEEALSPFFDDIWKACGLSRPKQK